MRRFFLACAIWGGAVSGRGAEPAAPALAHLSDAKKVQVMWQRRGDPLKAGPGAARSPSFEVPQGYDGDIVSVTYTPEEAPGEASAPEKATVEVTGAGYRVARKRPACAAPVYEVEWAKHGPLLLAWQAGTFEITRAGGRTVKKQVYEVPAPFTVDGPWQVSFPAGRGAPEKVAFDKLGSWTRRGEEGLRHFSGSAVYDKTVRVPDDLMGPGRRMMLDLGAVRDVATVTLNGQALGVLNKPPFVVDVTQPLKVGDNTLQISVTSPEGGRPAGRDGPPDSGLLGPVSIRTVFELPVGR